MTRDDVANRRIRELEAELEKLRNERIINYADGTLLKSLLDDIARRRETEAQLVQTQEWLDLAQQAGGVCAYTYDFSTSELHWSSSTMALYGFDAGEEPTLEKWLSAIHPDDRDAAWAVASTALKSHAEVNHRFRIVTPSGALRWIQDRARVVRGSEGIPVRLAGINIDVTELVELERRAFEDNQRLRIALATANNACWDWDLAQNNVTWDSQLSQLTGVEDFGGNFESFWALVHDDDKPKVRGALDAALTTGQDYRAEFRMVRPDGGVRWTSTRARVVRDESGRPVRLVGIDTDITEEKAAERALSEGQFFLASVLGASPDCIKVIETDGSLSYMNDNGRKVMEIDDFSSVAGRRWADLWPEECVHLVEGALGQALQGARSRFEGPCPTAAGTAKWWEVCTAPILDADGKVERIVSISRDITDRKLAEEQIRTLNEELHHRLKNNVATIQALARASLRGSSDLKTFEHVFTGRLLSLAKTYDVLRAGPEAASLGKLVETELLPFADASDRIVISGPDVMLSESAAVAVGMIIHELTTNAAKYGALVNPDGKLSVSWRHDEAGTQVQWREHLPSAVIGSTSVGGFGSVLIDRLARQLGATITRRWEEHGLDFQIAIPRDAQR